MTDHDLVKALKAIAHPTRFKMVQEVAAAGELSCGQLGDRFHVAQPTISHHLKLLSEAGVLIIRKEAQHHYISVNREVVQGLLGSLPGRLAPAGARAAVVKAAKGRGSRGLRRRSRWPQAVRAVIELIVCYIQILQREERDMSQQTWELRQARTPRSGSACGT